MSELEITKHDLVTSQELLKDCEEMRAHERKVLEKTISDLMNFLEFKGCTREFFTWLQENKKEGSAK